jgi:RNA polymerase sigma-70 factor (ECF subfamily)
MTLEAFQNMVFPVKNKLYRFAFRLLGNNEEAKDVVQEVMIKVWSGRDQLDQVQNLEAWCMRITNSLEKGMHLTHHSLTPAEATELGERMKRIAELMAELPDKQRQVMHLRDIEGYSYNEICEILEIDMSQVKVNLFRARNAVREKLLKMDAYGLA